MTGLQAKRMEYACAAAGICIPGSLAWHFLGWKKAVGKRVLLGRGEAFCQRIEGEQSTCNDFTLTFTPRFSVRRWHGIKGMAAVKLAAMLRRRRS